MLSQEVILRKSIGLIAGLGAQDQSLCGLEIQALGSHETAKPVVDAIASMADHSEKRQDPTDALTKRLLETFEAVKVQFLDYYTQDAAKLAELWAKVQKAENAEERAKWLTRLWAPELNLSEEEILPRWRISDVKPNPHPIGPEEVALQLNALYSLPEEIPADLPDAIKNSWQTLEGDPGKHIADYDHPVPLFVEEDGHELMSCLKELNDELGFEKEKGVISADFRVPVIISVSVTHAGLDGIAGDWIEHLLRRIEYPHLISLVLTESKVGQLKKALLKDPHDIFSVFGKYSVHFNALKYCQLLLEKAYGIRAGFKLDTDEGIRSRDLFKATGKTWMQTLCHDLWGGTAVDCHGREVCLGFNEGEYVNSKDIDKLGFANALRTPDVSAPKSYQGPEIFFNKAFAHARATALYNTFDSLDDHISHPVVKGGGYGITNDALRRFVPFTFSQVGRAEDQQFYFSGVAGGCRGIFHPNLRIAHYKGSGSAAAQSEARTEATRFIGDMYRLVIFSHLCDELPALYGLSPASWLKYDLDPMPGVFAGAFSRLQALLNLMLKSLSFIENDKIQLAEILLEDGLDELQTLCEQIDAGAVKRALAQEKKAWEAFIADANAVDPVAAKAVFDSLVI